MDPWYVEVGEARKYARRIWHDKAAVLVFGENAGPRVEKLDGGCTGANLSAQGGQRNVGEGRHECVPDFW